MYDLADNLHEYKVVVNDLQNKGEEIRCDRNDSPNNPPYSFCVKYPKKYFDPSPIVMELICERMNKANLRIIFADISYTEEYMITKLVGQADYRYVKKKVI